MDVDIHYGQWLSDAITIKRYNFADDQVLQKSLFEYPLVSTRTPDPRRSQIHSNIVHLRLQVGSYSLF
jgi:hypothetical protein